MGIRTNPVKTATGRIGDKQNSDMPKRRQPERRQLRSYRRQMANFAILTICHRYDCRFGVTPFCLSPIRLVTVLTCIPFMLLYDHAINVIVCSVVV